MGCSQLRFDLNLLIIVFCSWCWVVSWWGWGRSWGLFWIRYSDLLIIWLFLINFLNEWRWGVWSVFWLLLRALRCWTWYLCFTWAWLSSWVKYRSVTTYISFRWIIIIVFSQSCFWNYRFLLLTIQLIIRFLSNYIW